MTNRFLLCALLLCSTAALFAEQNYDPSTDSTWSSGFPSEEGGGASYLGVDIDDVSPERLSTLKLKEEHGAEITMVDQDAPAGKAGLVAHDVIVSLNGSPVESAAQLRRMIKETPAGRVINLGISRDGQPMNIKVQLADRHQDWDPNAKVHMPQMPQMPKLPSMLDFDLPVSVVVVHASARSGLMVENITSQLGDFFGVKDGKGVLVRSVEKGSRGESSGFHAGDVIVRVNDQTVHDTSDFAHALRSAQGATTTVSIIREKHEQTLTLTLPDRKDSGSIMEQSLDRLDLNAEAGDAISLAENEVALLGPEIEIATGTGLCQQDQAEHASKHLSERLSEQQELLQEKEDAIQDQLQEREEEFRDQQEEMRSQLQDQQEELRDSQQKVVDEQLEREQELIDQQQEIQQTLRHSSRRAEI